MTDRPRRASAKRKTTSEELASNNPSGVAILPSGSAVCLASTATVLGSAVPLNLTGVGAAIRPVLLTQSTLLAPNLLSQPQQNQQEQESTSADGSMAIKRERRPAAATESSDSDTDDDDTGDDSVSGDAWSGKTSANGSGSVGSSSKTARTDVAVDYSIASSSSGSQATAARPANTPRRHTGPRKPRVNEKLTPEEEERRRMRRERNKFAAAKCRQKRVDLTNQLLAETEKLESEQAKLQDDIKAFQREKDELEFILDAHRLHCGITPGQPSSTATTTTTAAAATTSAAASDQLRLLPTDGKVVLVLAGAPLAPANAPIDSALSTSSSAHSSTGPALMSTDSASMATIKVEEKGSSAARRPNSLVTPHLIGCASGTTGSAHVTRSQVAGVSITTPSAGINVYTLGLESMLDGHTGLTPITGLSVSLTGISTPIFAIPASVAGVPVEEVATSASSATSSVV